MAKLSHFSVDLFLNCSVIESLVCKRYIFSHKYHYTHFCMGILVAKKMTPQSGPREIMNMFSIFSKKTALSVQKGFEEAKL